jgi:hypothetical protein
MSGDAPKPGNAGGLEFPLKLEDLDEESERLYDWLKFKDDPATGNRVPRDLSDPVEALEVLRTVRLAAEFHKEPPTKANLIARKLYEGIGELFKQQLPDVAEILEKETALVIVRDAAQRMQDKYRAEVAKVRPLVYGGIAVVLYLVSMAVGRLAVLTVGAAVMLFAFWRSLLCTSSRAAFSVWLADMLEHQQRRPRQ